MISRKRLALFTALVMLLAFAAPMGAFAAPVNKGAVLYTNIRAYINGQELPYYMLDIEYAAVAVTDLTNYGFDLKTDAAAKTATLTFNTAKAINPLPTVEQVGTVDAVAYRYFTTDWKVVINGKAVPSYNIAGRLSCQFRELDVFGTRVYDDKTKTTKLTVKGANTGGGTASGGASGGTSGGGATAAAKYAIAGTITNTSGSAIANATVILHVTGVSGSRQAVTGANGAYTFSDVATGSNCYIEATAMNYTANFTDAFSVNGNVTGKNIRLSQSISVSGKVTVSGTGAAVSGATVKLAPNTGSALTQYTDSSGNYTFNNVMAGSYTVNVTATGYNAFTSESFGVSTAAVTKNASLTRAGNTITGALTTSLNLSISNIPVELRQGGVNGTVLSTVRTDNYGRFEFPSLQNGTYYTVVRATTTYGETSRVVTVNSNSPNVTMPLVAPGAIITGTARIPAGVYVDPATVQVRLYDDSRTEYSDFQTLTFYSNYETNVTSDQFSIAVTRSFTGTRSLHAEVTYRYRGATGAYDATGTVASATVSVSGDAPATRDVGQIVLTATSATRTISGTITGIPSGKTAQVYITGTPAYGAAWSGNNTSITAPASGVSNGGGVAYTFSNVPDGNYTIYAAVDGIKVTDNRSVVVSGTNATGVDLTAYNNASVTINFTQYNSFSSQLVNVNTNGYSVRLEAVGSQLSMSYTVPKQQDGTTTWTFTSVPAGYYILTMYEVSPTGINSQQRQLMGSFEVTVGNTVKSVTVDFARYMIS